MPGTKDEEEHIDQIASAVQALLAGQSQRRLRARLAGWPGVIDDADDICQLAAIAFVEAYRRGRIAPDAERGAHTAQSVAAYAWGICNRVFCNTVRRSRPRSWEYAEHDRRGGALSPPEVDQLSGGRQGGPPTGHLYGYDLLDEVLGDSDDDEDRLWEVLSSVESRCRPEDIIVTYLLASGVTSGELRELLQVSINTPQNALRRVGREIRELIGLGARTSRPQEAADADETSALREDR